MARQHVVLVLGLLTFVVPSLAGSNVLEYDVETGSCGGQFNQSVGWQFDVLEPITVQALSWADEDLDGLSVPHLIGIWDPAGNLLASTVIPVGTDAELRGIWRSVPIPPVTLAPGNGYIVGGLESENSIDRLAFNVDLTFVNSSIHFIDAMFGPQDNTFQRPTSHSIAENGFYGPSFQLEGGQSDCLVVTGWEIACYADGSAFTWTVQGVNTCTGASQTLNFTGSGAAGEPVCFTLTVNDENGGLCCETELCVEVPDCSPPALPGDLDGDGAVQVLDLLALLAAWGACPIAIDPAGGCPADLNGDGNVGILDLLILLGNWG